MALELELYCAYSTTVCTWKDAEEKTWVVLGSSGRIIEVSGRAGTSLCATGPSDGMSTWEKELGTCSTGVASRRYLCPSKGILGNKGWCWTFPEKSTVISCVKTTVSRGQEQLHGYVTSAVAQGPVLRRALCFGLNVLWLLSRNFYKFLSLNLCL